MGGILSLPQSCNSTTIWSDNRNTEKAVMPGNWAATKRGGREMSNRALWGLCFFVLSCCSCHTVLAAPQVGWYWNPNESGRGFFVESQNGITFIGAYLYDADGHAKWLIAGGPNDDPYNFSGDLIYKTNGQTLFGPYAAPGDAIVVGRLTVHFSDDTHATLTWPGGTVQIERQIFGAGNPAFQAASGWWWNPDESGSGYSIEVQGDKLFMVGFMYDDTGRPVWILSAGTVSDAKTYHGTVLQFANGQTMSGPYQPPSAPANVATVDITLDAPDSGTLAFSDATGSKVHVKRQRRTPIRREFAPPPYTYPLAFQGTFSYTAHTHLSDSGVDNDIQITYTIDTLTLERAFTSSTEAGYGSLATTFNATYYQVNSGLGSTCILQDQVAAPVAHFAAASLFVTPSGFYTFSATVHVPFVLDGTCTTDTGTFPVGPVAYTWDLTLPDFNGAIFNDTIQGADSALSSTVTSHWEWTLHAIRDQAR